MRQRRHRPIFKFLIPCQCQRDRILVASLATEHRRVRDALPERRRQQRPLLSWQLESCRDNLVQTRGYTLILTGQKEKGVLATPRTQAGLLSSTLLPLFISALPIITAGNVRRDHAISSLDEPR